MWHRACPFQQSPDRAGAGVREHAHAVEEARLHLHAAVLHGPDGGRLALDEVDPPQRPPGPVLEGRGDLRRGPGRNADDLRDFCKTVCFLLSWAPLLTHSSLAEAALPEVTPATCAVAAPARSRRSAWSTSGCWTLSASSTTRTRQPARLSFPRSAAAAAADGVATFFFALLARRHSL